jgi:hypothetical protein
VSFSLEAVSGASNDKEEPMSKAVPVVIPDELVLAAVERSVRHHPKGSPVVPAWEVYDHLGWSRRSGAARRVRALLDALEAAGSLERSRRHGVPLWALTNNGRRRLQRARRAGSVPELPESPQHRAWRDARASAAQEIERFRQVLRDCLEQGLVLLDADPSADSDVWFLLGRRLCPACSRLGSAVHCLREWPEPEDARADIDHGALPEAGASYRVGRRNVRYWDSPETS